MKRTRQKDEALVQTHVEGQKPEKNNQSLILRHDKLEKTERLWFVQFAQLRRHSRVLYIPVDSTIVRLYRLRKGDVVKFMLLELRRAPGENEPIHEVSQSESMDEGELK